MQAKRANFAIITISKEHEMKISLTLKNSTALLFLCFIMQETHEITHTTVGRIVCGCWGKEILVPIFGGGDEIYALNKHFENQYYLETGPIKSYQHGHHAATKLQFHQAPAKNRTQVSKKICLSKQ